MRRNTSLYTGSHFRPALGNALQDEQVGLIPASDAPAAAARFKGADVRFWETPDAGVATATYRTIDSSINWRNRKVWGYFRNLGASDRRLGRANDHLANDPTATPATVRRTFDDGTGAGGKGAAAATVTNGVPPVIADNQLAVVLDQGDTAAARIWLYADPTDGSLRIYNDSGATLHGDLLVFGAGLPPTPVAGVPDVIPTLTEVTWQATTDALRPADPEGPVLHRSTDTEAISLFDGVTWRSLAGGATSLPASPSTGDLARWDGSAWVAVSVEDVVADGLDDLLGTEAEGTTYVGDGAGGSRITSAAVANLLESASAAEERTALDVYSTSQVDTLIAGVGSTTPDTITELITPGGGTSGQTTLRLTITDSLSAARVGVLVMLAHYADASSIPTVNLGAEVSKNPRGDSFAGVTFMITNASGQVQCLFNAPSGTVTNWRAHVFSVAPATLAGTAFTAP